MRPRRLVLAAILLVVAGCGSAASAPAPSAAPTGPADWPTYHADLARSGAVDRGPSTTGLRMAWQARLDGAVYGQPLVVGDVVVAATENDSVYGLDAASGDVRWRAHAGEPVRLAALPCGNIDPLGITGTPAYDEARGLVFAVAEVAGPQHVLMGVDVATGEVRVRRQVDRSGQDPRVNQQRAALAVANGRVYVAYGGLFGDCGDYRGGVVAVRTDGSGPLESFTVPTSREGGIWGPSGPVVLDGGDLLVAVGNGAATGGEWDHSDAVLRLSPDLALQSGFAPTSWPHDNAVDADLGSMGPVLLPGGLVFIAGKGQTGYVVRADALGGVGGAVASAPVCAAFGGAAVLGRTVFVPCADGVRQVLVDPAGSLRVGWHAAGAINGSPVVAGTAPDAVLWVLGGDGSAGGDTLYALDAGSGEVRGSVIVGPTPHFASPTVTPQRVYVGTAAGVTAVAGG